MAHWLLYAAVPVLVVPLGFLFLRFRDSDTSPGLMVASVSAQAALGILTVCALAALVDFLPVVLAVPLAWLLGFASARFHDKRF